MHASDYRTALTLICRPDILIGVYRRAWDFAVLLRAGADTILVPAKLSAVRMLRVTEAQWCSGEHSRASLVVRALGRGRGKDNALAF